jgi:hypothetical protein
MKNIRSRIYFYLVVWVGSLFFWQCEPTHKKKDLEASPYRTSDSSRLFFKNVRQIFYDKQVIEAAQLEQYRIKERLTSTEKPLLNLCIINNWKFDEAYILLEPNELLADSDSLYIHWSDPALGESGTWAFGFGNKDVHYQLASGIYQGLLSEFSFSITYGEQTTPLFASPEEREPFRKTMYDFYRLVEKP